MPGGDLCDLLRGMESVKKGDSSRFSAIVSGELDLEEQCGSAFSLWSVKCHNSLLLGRNWRFCYHPVFDK